MTEDIILEVKRPSGKVLTLILTEQKPAGSTKLHVSVIIGGAGGKSPIKGTKVYVGGLDQLALAITRAAFLARGKSS